ncbi:DUF883 family protein [Aestuariicella hydrocarbonica]|uniref:DUF883 family protein n=1 Tax=Pseudomaricurvus hydrocarbonicus TaxID=1470433 RepID=A0A9E5MLE0_9GAMM|nr:DUF883 family protein [Aestuariicella hydrocarbonica]NHO64328.1 DUF883 family protein [Aestuariicella hydrocarbonica]
MATANAKSTDKQDELAASKESVMEAYDKLMEAKSHFRKAAEAAGMDLKHDAADQLLKGREKAGELSAQADTYIRDKPLASLGIAFAAGFILAQLFSRK